MLTKARQAEIKLALTFAPVPLFSNDTYGGRNRRLEAFTGAMANGDDMPKLSWPWWAPWALLAVAVTSVLTIVVTVYTAG
jgi:hypothetical protein